ncbi:MAG: 4-(cytidine 5'-diphospho)-2-C-methyl-D-erythritol kinase [Acidimicrobiales bacterium]
MNATTEPTVLRAAAKLTLSLRVTGLRDDGYHLIESEMVTVDLFDVLEVTPGDALVVEGLGAGSVVGSGDDNLVRKALRLAGRTASVTLRKAIPAGAGLGGGSADAAAILRWAGYSDLAAASRLGADVPFCMLGGRALVSGIGEHVEPLDVRSVLGRQFTLLVPPLHVATAEVFATWDRLGGPTGESTNDLEPAAVAAFPELALWRDRLATATGRTPRLAGSGGTWFVDGAYPGEGLLVVSVTR